MYAAAPGEALEVVIRCHPADEIQTSKMARMMGMGLNVATVMIDCADPDQLAQFWSAALDLPVQGGFGDFIFLAAPAGGGPRIALQRVPEPRAGKNRLHVDLTGEARATAVPRLQALGASIVAEHKVPGLVWTVLADPEGNEFCIGEHPDNESGPT